MLVLQYNRIVLERTQDDLHATDRFVGQVHFSIWKSDHSTAFEYAMQEDHLPHTSGNFLNLLMLYHTTNLQFIAEQPSNPSLFDTDLT